MRHAAAAATPVSPLAVGVVGPALRARLVASAGLAHLAPPRQVPAVGRAVPVPPITRPADLKSRAATPTWPVSKLFHPSPPAEEVSTGGPTAIIISSETKRLHPRGGPAATGPPVSSSGTLQPQAAQTGPPVSCHGRIPRTSALATIASPRFAAIVSIGTAGYSWSPPGGRSWRGRWLLRPLFAGSPIVRVSVRVPSSSPSLFESVVPTLKYVGLLLGPKWAACTARRAGPWCAARSTSPSS